MMIHVDQILLKPVDVVDCEGLGEEDEGENNTDGFPGKDILKSKLKSWIFFNWFFEIIFTLSENIFCIRMFSKAPESRDGDS